MSHGECHRVVAVEVDFEDDVVVISSVKRYRVLGCADSLEVNSEASSTGELR